MGETGIKHPGPRPKRRLTPADGGDHVTQQLFPEWSPPEKTPDEWTERDRMLFWAFMGWPFTLLGLMLYWLCLNLDRLFTP